jgi:Ni/Co efflux regulator RcnB
MKSILVALFLAQLTALPSAAASSATIHTGSHATVTTGQAPRRTLERKGKKDKKGEKVAKHKQHGKHRTHKNGGQGLTSRTAASHVDRRGSHR